MADIFANFAYAKLVANIDSAATSLRVDSVTRIPSATALASGEFWMTIESTLGAGEFEIIRVTGVDATAKTLTVVRAQQGTVARSHSLGAVIKHAITSDVLVRLRDHTHAAGSSTNATRTVLTAVTGNHIVTLGADPYQESLQIFVNGHLHTEWTYDAAARTATFPKGWKSGDVVAVHYLTTAATPVPEATLSGNLALINDNAESFGTNWVVETGTWTDAEAGFFRQTDIANTAKRLRWKQAEVTDGEYSAKIRFPSAGQSAGDIYAGLVWTQTTGGTGGILLRFQRVAGAWQVQWEVESVSAVTNAPIDALLLDTWYTLKAVRSGNVITAFVNGVQVGAANTVTPSSNLANVPALYNYGCIADYDDILYTA